jgi:Peptidase family M23/PGAP1-like protein
MVRWFSSFVVACVVALSPTMGAAPAAAGAVGPQSTYVPPITPPAGVITDRFRPPPTPYAAGNRGLDYATVPGSPIVASASGVVVFAGPVAQTLHVTIQHPDGLRTTYSFLARVAVAVGQRVAQAQVVGVAGAVLHFGVRDREGDYLDPEALFAGRAEAHLIPGPDDGAPPLAPDSTGEARQLLGIVREVAGRLTGPLGAMAEEELSLVPSVSAYRLARELDAFRRSQWGCTLASVRVPPPSHRRIAVLVGGIGTTDTGAAVDRVDTNRLGYAPSDVLRFSYAGGRVASRSAPRGALATIPATHYQVADTEAELQVSASRLVDLLDQVATAAPGVAVDVIAHSQGGVVARLAVDQAIATHRLPAHLGLIVTIASPHQGDDAATADQAAASPSARLVVRAAVGGSGLGLDPDGVSEAELSQVSMVASQLSRPVPTGVRVLSIGASGDLTVPWVRTLAGGATSVLVDLEGPSAHDRLPAAPATTRAIALALAGRAPACVALSTGVREVVTSHLAAQTEDALGLSLALATLP